MNMKEAYYSENTPELRVWLREQGLTPVAYPDCERQGLTAPYPNCMGEMVMYNDGLRFETDDDASEFVICASEEEFRDNVVKLMDR